MNYESLCNEVILLSQQIGDWMVAERTNFSQGNVETKAFNNLVSYVDKRSEEMFMEKLMQLIPDCGILGEEGSSINLNSDYIWIIDPLDGTTNFVHGVPVFCTSVALQHKDKTVLGVVYEPNRKECFYAWEGSKSFCNKKEISVSAASTLNESLLATGFPYDDFGKMENYVNLLKDLMKETRGIRRLGAAALDLCYVASGRFEAFYEYALQPWDVAAGAFIVQQAGGKVTDFMGGDTFNNGETIIASNTKIHPILEAKTRHYF